MCTTRYAGRVDPVLALLSLPAHSSLCPLSSSSSPATPLSAHQDIYELKDQIQDVEGRYMQGLKELKVVGTSDLQHVFSLLFSLSFQFLPHPRPPSDCKP